MKENILITGANGFIGSALARYLRANHYQIIGLDVKDPYYPENYDLWLKCDLTSESSLKTALMRCDETFPNQELSVIHLAAYYDFSGADSPLYKELTVNGTKRLLTMLQRLNVVQFQFASTILVMEEVKDENQRISENSPTNPKWKYPESKLATEDLIRQEQGKIPTVIHRIAGVYNDWCHSPPISEQIVRILERRFESFFFPGNKEHGQPFLHIDDLVNVLHRTLIKKESLEHLEVFTIGEDKLLSYEELQNIIGDFLYHREWPTIGIPKSMAKVGAWLMDKVTEKDEFIQPWMVDLADAHFPIDIRKAKEKLGWKPQHNLKDKIPVILENLKQDPEKWYRINNKDPQDIPASVRILKRSNLKSNIGPRIGPGIDQ